MEFHCRAAGAGVAEEHRSPTPPSTSDDASATPASAWRRFAGETAATVGGEKGASQREEGTALGRRRTAVVDYPLLRPARPRGNSTPSPPSRAPLSPATRTRRC